MPIRVSRGDLEAARAMFKPLPMTQTKLGRVIPKGWTAGKMDESTWWYRSPEDMAVFESVSGRETYTDGKRWQHISVSFGDHVPTWNDLGMVKRIFMGHEVTALQVLPPVSRYVNIHKYCLHLWRCLDGDVTPDFSTVSEGVRHV